MALSLLSVQNSDTFDDDVRRFACIQLEKIKVAQRLTAGALLADHSDPSLTPRTTARGLLVW